MRTAAATAATTLAAVLVAAAGAPAQRAKSAAALAYADAVTIRPSDLPEYPPNAQQTRTQPTEKRLESELAGCVEAPPSKGALAEAESPEFARSNGLAEESISSHAEVLATALAARRTLARIRSAPTRRCLSRYIVPLLRDQERNGVKLDNYRVSALPGPASYASRSFGWRIVATVTDRGIRAKVRIDFRGFACGRAVVELFSLGVPVPFPAATEQRLFGLLLSRAEVAARSQPTP